MRQVKLFNLVFLSIDNILMVRRTCGIIVRRLRNVCNPILDMSTPSTRIDPSAASTIRNKLRVKEDFPAPVRPTIPTYSDIIII